MRTMPPADKYTILRDRFQVFCFDGYKVTRFQDKLKITFDFYLDEEYEFHPTMTMEFPDKLAAGLSGDHIDQLVFHIGMVELISYWKAACPPRVIIRPYKLEKDQLDFWKKLYFHGLGEFFHTNEIDADFDSFMEIESESKQSLKDLKYHLTKNFVVPVGGGKDSVVTLQLLNEFTEGRQDIVPMIINPRGASEESIARAGFNSGDVFRIQRTIDPVLLKMNEEGFLNGHTPFSALLAFTSLLVSALTKNAMIALSNESSADEASVPGTNVNHQYSKSLEFEKDFRAYVSKYISQDFEYFSFLRPLTEFQIAKIFSLYPQYFDDFKSCNVGSKENRWCGKCPKCLFTFIILSPFVKNSELERIFGHNLLDDPEHLVYYRQLSGQEDQKPFECVGTINEVSLALALVARQYETGKEPLLIRDFMQTDIYIKYKNKNAADEILSHFHENNLPGELEQKLKQYLLKSHCK